MRILTLIAILCVLSADAHAQVVYLVGNDLPPVRITEQVGPADTLTVLVNTADSLSGYMIHRADSVHYRIDGRELSVSRETWSIVLLWERWIAAWEALRRLGEP